MAPDPATTGLAGLLLAVEGGDGAGKGGVIAAVADALRDAGHPVLVTREPGGTPEGEALRGLLVAGDADWIPAAELLLMTAARVQHVDKMVLPALAAGQIVICDRYIGSTLAYQGAGRGLSEADIRAVHRRFVHDLWPDFTLLIDVAPAVGLARSRDRLAADASGEGRFEGIGEAFHARVREGFLTQAAADPGRFAILDGHLPAAELHAAAIARVLALLPAS